MFRFLYIVFLGLLISVTIGASMEYLYSSPRYPEPPEYNQDDFQNYRDPNNDYRIPDDAEPVSPSYAPEMEKKMKINYNADSASSDQYVEQEKKYEEDLKAYDAALAIHSNNSKIIVIAIAVILVLIAGALYGKIPVFPESLLIGAILIISGVSSLTSLLSMNFDYSGYDGAGGESGKLTIIQLCIFYACLLIASIIGYVTFKKKLALDSL